MNWEKLTAIDFENAVEECGGVCLLPIGVIEKHGDHLPLGQDILYIHRLCTDAAKIEPAMVFPQYYFGKINEARHQPGTVAISFDLLLPLLESVCDEISRNGFKKIIIVNGHGGNNSFLPYFTEMLLEKEKDYMVFFNCMYQECSEKEKEILSAELDGHGGEVETSCSSYYFPELVKSDTPAGYGMPLNRLKAYETAGLRTSISWYAKYPGHLAADKTPATAEKGKVIVECKIKRLAEAIKLLKQDNTAFELYKKYHKQTQKPSTKNT